MCQSCRTMPLVGGYSRGSPVSAAPVFWHSPNSQLTSPSSALKTSKFLKQPCDFCSYALTYFLAAVVYWSVHSPPTEANRAETSPDFRKWESRRTIPLVSGFYWGYPFSSTFAFRRFSILASLHSYHLSRPR
ncbi:hypothetical protein PR048_011965 [Dryococelus australis]|uniref:Uncharacterized protein n=1 Tax=Dryococelus australis TaxID=614101 RepID=A0ABQ9HN04_9NEOP|nr:hypothetical protein PR048_011965 [Dryococelus australis]